MKTNSELLSGTESMASCMVLKSPLPYFSTLMRTAVEKSLGIVAVEPQVAVIEAKTIVVATNRMLTF